MGHAAILPPGVGARGRVLGLGAADGWDGLSFHGRLPQPRFLGEDPRHLWGLQQQCWESHNSLSVILLNNSSPLRSAFLQTCQQPAETSRPTGRGFAAGLRHQTAESHPPRSRRCIDFPPARTPPPTRCRAQLLSEHRAMGPGLRLPAPRLLPRQTGQLQHPPLRHSERSGHPVNQLSSFSRA